MIYILFIRIYMILLSYFFLTLMNMNWGILMNNQIIISIILIILMKIVFFILMNINLNILNCNLFFFLMSINLNMLFYHVYFILKCIHIFICNFFVSIGQILLIFIHNLNMRLLISNSLVFHNL